MIAGTLPRRVTRILERLSNHVVRLFLAFNFLAYGASNLLNLQFAWGYEQFDRPVRQLGGQAKGILATRIVTAAEFSREFQLS